MKTIKLFALGALLIGAFCFGKVTNSLQEKHPHMSAAKNKLQEAKDQLQKAAHTYDGHRVKAIEYIESALKEINEGLASQKK
jgi:hypothetical protein